MEAIARGNVPYGVGVQVPKDPSPLMQHSQKLALLGEHLANQNERLATIIGRLIGPEPPNGAIPEPIAQSGVLHAAAFEATRISNGLDKLSGLISKLDETI